MIIWNKSIKTVFILSEYRNAIQAKLYVICMQLKQRQEVNLS